MLAIVTTTGRGAFAGIEQWSPRTAPKMNRRDVLKGAGMIAGSTAAKAMTQAYIVTPQPAHKLKIVVTGGHPGDPEYGCGGTVARLTALGHEVVLLYLN